MKDKRVIWAVLAVISFLLLVLVLHSPERRPKAVPQRITAVNSLRYVSLVLTNTNALPITRSSPGK